MPSKLCICVCKIALQQDNVFYWHAIRTDEVPFLRPADGAISIAMDRRVSDGAVVSTSFDVHIPQRGAGVFHLALASLPVSTIVSLKLRVGDQSPLR